MRLPCCTEQTAKRAFVYCISTFRGTAIQGHFVDGWMHSLLHSVHCKGLCCLSSLCCCCIQVETGSAITWKYPSCVLKGDNSVGEFYSVALTNNAQQADTGTKMIHIGKNTRSKIISKGISAGNSRNAYRGLVQVLHIPFDTRNALSTRIALSTSLKFDVNRIQHLVSCLPQRDCIHMSCAVAHSFCACMQVQPGAEGARNFSQCDSMLIGDNAAANTYPYIQVSATSPS
jgi:hypothetical protein